PRYRLFPTCLLVRGEERSYFFGRNYAALVYSRTSFFAVAQTTVTSLLKSVAVRLRTSGPVAFPSSTIPGVFLPQPMECSHGPYQRPSESPARHDPRGRPCATQHAARSSAPRGDVVLP